jgi:hypothetical protein
MGYAPSRQLYGAKRDSIHLVIDDSGGGGDGSSGGGGGSDGYSSSISIDRQDGVLPTPRTNHLEYRRQHLSSGPLSSPSSSPSSSSSLPVGHALDLADSSVRQSILGAGLIDWMLCTSFQVKMMIMMMCGAYDDDV